MCVCKSVCVCVCVCVPTDSFRSTCPILGVPETGAAAVDPNSAEAHITIEGGNEPHGVFAFAPRVLDAPPRIPETGAYNLTVDRKFGAIGEISL